MPPPVSRSSLSSLTRRQSCPALVFCPRQFGTSSPLSKIGPESPKFIEIPRGLQAQAIRKREVKGTLPPPRNLFHRNGADKTSTKYLAFATPEPTAHHQLSEPQNDYIAWKRHMAATRRQNLREGLVELHSRKVKNDKTMAYRSARKREDREKRVHAPEREDERLTSTTITLLNRKLQLGNVPDPNREERIAAAKARVEAKAKILEQDRLDALHTLYIHARDFITTEAQLDAAIEKVFVDTPFETNTVSGRASTNVWEAHGPPPSVQDLLGEVNHTQKNAIDFHSSPAVPYGKRMLQIAEELTGGKMEKM